MFLVAQIPFIEYSQYDAYVEVVNNYGSNEADHISEEILRTLHFKMAYFNPNFTDMQLSVRTTFILLTLSISIWYLIALCKGVPRHVTYTYDQKQLVMITLGCVFFNDPTYLASVYKPGIFASVVSQLWVAVFLALLLNYWLRGVETVKE